jgi:hypothetical protein
MRRQQSVMHEEKRTARVWGLGEVIQGRKQKLELSQPKGRGETDARSSNEEGQLIKKETGAEWEQLI